MLSYKLFECIAISRASRTNFIKQKCHLDYKYKYKYTRVTRVTRMLNLDIKPS